MKVGLSVALASFVVAASLAYPAAAQSTNLCHGTFIEQTCCHGANWQRKYACIPAQQWQQYQQCIDALGPLPTCPPGEHHWLMVVYTGCWQCNASGSGIGWIRKVGSCRFECHTQGDGACISTACLGVVECVPWNLNCDQW
jgi:hypothetical protein